MATPEPVVISNRETPAPVHHFSTGASTEANGQAAVKSKDDKEHVHGLQDRLLNSLLGQLLPAESNAQTPSSPETNATTVHVTTPGFSLPVMSVNFRRFNARIGVVFAFQAELGKLFAWEKPTHTFSLLLAYTFIALNPTLIIAIPLVILLFFIMVPSFLTRHPPTPFPAEGTLQDTLDAAAPAEIENAWATYSYNPAAVAPPKRVAPASNLSQDFLNNMRDLQNSMADFSNIHDVVVQKVSPMTDFSDEALSSTIFLAVFGLIILATLGGHLIPFRLIAAGGGILLIGGGHPAIAPHLAHLATLPSLKEMQAHSAAQFRRWMDTDIILDAEHEVREVEVFELQQRRLKVDAAPPATVDETAAPQPEHRLRRSASTNTIGESVNWEPWLYTTSPHDPLSPHRLSGAWPVGTQFFEDVKPPAGWSWKGSRWTLDTLSGAWVEERCMTGVEVEKQGGRWVYDIDYGSGDEGSADGKSQGPGAVNVKSWEESDFGDRRGSWRRRRWVRLVERNGSGQ